MRLVEKYLVLFVASSLLSLFAWHTWGETAAPVMAAFWGIVFFTPAPMDVLPWLFQYQKRRALQALNGKHYEFGATRIRVFYAADRIWVASEDLHRALGLPLNDIDRQRLQRGNRHLTVPGTNIMGISEDDLRDYVLSLRSTENQKFILWFENNVAQPLHTKIALGNAIPERTHSGQR